MRKCASVILLLCSLQICFAQKKQLPVRVIEATKQNWVSGAPGGRTGTKYSVKVYINTPRKIEFTNLWIGLQNVAFDVEFFSLDIPKKIQNGDSLLLTYNKVNGYKTESSVAKHLPLRYKGVALIEATVDYKVRYFAVKNFKQLADKQGM
jgi:hypothetical protein